MKNFPPIPADQLTGGGELSGIQLLEDERPWLNRARREVESQGKKMLLQGLELMVRYTFVLGWDHAQCPDY